MGVLRIRSVTGGREPGACRARRHGSDDTLTVWLNGEKLLSKNVARACVLGSERLRLWLDCNSDFYGTYENNESFFALVGP